MCNICHLLHKMLICKQLAIDKQARQACHIEKNKKRETKWVNKQIAMACDFFRVLLLLIFLHLQLKSLLRRIESSCLESSRVKSRVFTKSFIAARQFPDVPRKNHKTNECARETFGDIEFANQYDTMRPIQCWVKSRTIAEQRWAKMWIFHTHSKQLTKLHQPHTHYWINLWVPFQLQMHMQSDMHFN